LRVSERVDLVSGRDWSTVNVVSRKSSYASFSNPAHINPLKSERGLIITSRLQRLGSLFDLDNLLLNPPLSLPLQPLNPGIRKRLIKAIPIPCSASETLPLFRESGNLALEGLVVAEFVEEDGEGEEGADEGDVLGVRVGDFLREGGDLFVGEVGEVGG
jgi:hypothetical protein